MKILNKYKKIIIIGGLTILGVIGLVIGGINIVNSKDYKEIKNQYQEVLGESIHLGLIHRKEEIEQAIVDFDTKVEEYQKEIDNKVKSLSFDAKAFISTNKLDVPTALSKQIELLNTVGLLDNVKAINTYDNYKPAKSNDAIKKEIKDIDTKASAAYDLIVEEISTKFKVTKDDVTKFLKGLDFKKALTEAQMKSLRTLATVDFSDEFIKQISDAKVEIKKIVDNIKKEVKTIQDKEKKDADAAKAKASGNTSGNYNGGNYTSGGSNYSNNGSSSNKGGSSNSGSSNRPTVSNPNAIGNMSPAAARDAIERDLFTIIRGYGKEMGVEANPVIGPYAGQSNMANSWIGDANGLIDARQWDSYSIAQSLFNAYLENKIAMEGSGAVPRGTFYVNVYVTSDYKVSASIAADFS